MEHHQTNTVAMEKNFALKTSEQLPLSFTCGCGRRFQVGPGRYVCRTCNTEHFYKIDRELHQANRAERRERVQRAVARNRKLVRAVRLVLGGLMYGDAIARLEMLAVQRGSKIAENLSSILYKCGCSRSMAIDELNKLGWPSYKP